MRVDTSTSQLVFLSLIFLLSEWLRAVQVHAQSHSGRRHLKSSFTSSILNPKLLSSGIFCVLKKQFNWFKSPSSLKRNASYWSGRYICIHCGTTFTAKIVDDPEHSSRAHSDVQLQIGYNQTSCCTERHVTRLLIYVSLLFCHLI